MSEGPDYEHAAGMIYNYVKAALGADLGEYGPEEEEDWDVAFEGLGRVAVYAASHTEWRPDFHWSNWKTLIPGWPPNEPADV